MIGEMSLDNSKKCVHACVLGKGAAEVEDSEKLRARPTFITYRLCDFRLRSLTSQSVSSLIKQKIKTLFCPPQVTCRIDFYEKGKELCKNKRLLLYSLENNIVFLVFRYVQI